MVVVAPARLFVYAAALTDPAGVEGAIGGHEHAGVGMQAQILAGVADDADAIDGGVEVEAEGRAAERTEGRPRPLSPGR